jgi:hypothetical protein
MKFIKFLFTFILFYICFRVLDLVLGICIIQSFPLIRNLSGKPTPIWFFDISSMISIAVIAIALAYNGKSLKILLMIPVLYYIRELLSGQIFVFLTCVAVSLCAYYSTVYLKSFRIDEGKIE